MKWKGEATDESWTRYMMRLHNIPCKLMLSYRDKKVDKYQTKCRFYPSNDINEIADQLLAEHLKLTNSKEGK